MIPLRRGSAGKFAVDDNRIFHTAGGEIGALSVNLELITELMSS
jgi:hypothetical protein